MRFDPDAYFADGGAVKAPSAPIQAGGRQYSPREVQALLGKLASLGINKDKLIAQITPHEAAVLRSMGGSGKINPRTGLLSFDDEGGGDGEGGADGEGAGGDPTGDQPSGADYQGSGGELVDNAPSAAPSDALTGWDETQGSGTNTPGELQGGVLGSLDAALGGSAAGPSAFGSTIGEFGFSGPTGVLTDTTYSPDSALSTPGFGDFGAKGISEGVTFDQPASSTIADALGPTTSGDFGLSGVVGGKSDLGTNALNDMGVFELSGVVGKDNEAETTPGLVFGPSTGLIGGESGLFDSNLIGMVASGQMTLDDALTAQANAIADAQSGMHVVNIGGGTKGIDPNNPDNIGTIFGPVAGYQGKPAEIEVVDQIPGQAKTDAEKAAAEQKTANEQKTAAEVITAANTTPSTQASATTPAAQTAAQDAAAWSATQAAAATQAAQAASKADEENKAQEAAAARTLCQLRSLPSFKLPTKTTSLARLMTTTS